MACDTVYTSQTLNNQIAIKKQDSDNFIYLSEVIPAPPCEPFSRFANPKISSPQDTKATLQFLSDGMRGFYMKLNSSTQEVIIQVGDVVYHVDI